MCTPFLNFSWGALKLYRGAHPPLHLQEHPSLVLSRSTVLVTQTFAKSWNKLDIFKKAPLLCSGLLHPEIDLTPLLRTLTITGTVLNIGPQSVSYSEI